MWGGRVIQEKKSGEGGVDGKIVRNRPPRRGKWSLLIGYNTQQDHPPSKRGASTGQRG